MQKHALVPLLGLLVPLVGLLPACSSKHHHHPPEHRTPRLVSIEVEVYDPVTNQVWQDVGVRIVEAEQEWARRTFVNNDPDAWYLTDENGVVYFAPRDLAIAGVGFIEDDLGRALLEGHADTDEAWVLIEVWAPGFEPVFAEVRLDWHEPDRFVAIPFE